MIQEYRRRETSFRGVGVATAVLLVLWAISARVLDILALPGPTPVLLHLGTGALAAMSKHLAISLSRIVVSMALAFCAAVPLGMVLGRVFRVDQVLAPFIYLLYPIPKIVLLPVLLIIVGVGDLSKVLLISLIVFFQLLVTTRDATKSLSPQLLLSMRSLGAGARDLYRHVVLPACLPKIFSCLRISLGTAIAVLFLAETYATNLGIGFYIMDALARFDYVDVFAGVFAVSVMGFAMFQLLELLERFFCPWRYA